MADERPLEGLRVLECPNAGGGWTGAFAGHLLAAGGADVVRVVPPTGDPLASEPPFFGDSGVSIQETWYNLGKRVVAIDPASADGAAELRELAAAADVLLEDWDPNAQPLSESDLAANPRLVRVSLTHTGRTAEQLVTNDLIANALSGAAFVSGDVDTPPLTGYGNQSYHTAGLFAAVTALAGWRGARISGRGSHIDLSCHEVLASCTEQVLMYWMLMGPQGPKTIAQRQGALHWSGLYSVYPDRDALGMHVTAALRLVDEVIPWMASDGAAGELANAERFPNIGSYVQAAPYLMDTMRKWVATKSANEMFFEAQARHLPWAPAVDIPTVAASPQAADRAIFPARDVPGLGKARMPLRLFRTDADGASPAPARRVSAGDVGWAPRSPSAASPSAQLPSGRPLEGVRILDFTHVLAGPYGTRLLADLGADVIKLGTAVRATASNSPAHPYYLSWNRNKRSIMIDMARARGRDLARRLAGQCDVIIDNFSDGVLRRWGMDRAGLSAINPKLTVVSMGGMGRTGPWKDFVTFAPTIHALSGLTAMTTFPDHSLNGYGFSLTDHLCGLAGALAVLEGVEHAARTGQGLDIDLSQYEVGIGIMAPGIIDHFANGTNPEPAGNRHPFAAWAPHGIYPSAGEDRWVAIAVRGDDEWRALCAVMSHSELAGDPRFATHAARIANEDALDAFIEDWTRHQDHYAVMAACQAAGIAAGAVQDARDLEESDAALAARGFFGVSQESGGTPSYRIDHFPALFDGARPDVYRSAHQLGADTFDILSDILNLPDDEIAELMVAGVLT